MYFGLMAILFDPNSRFGFLKKQQEKIKKKKAQLSTVILLLLSFSLHAQEPVNAQGNESQEVHTNHQAFTTVEDVNAFITDNAVSKEHAAKFGMR